MAQMGIGAILGMLSGNASTVAAHDAAVGQVIASMSLIEDDLRIGLANGTTLVARDDGQSCCERRYMRTDDVLGQFVGSTFIRAEIRNAPNEPDEWGEPHEVQFLLVNTSTGTATFSNHNEHNGYYGGFSVTLSIEPPKAGA